MEIYSREQVKGNMVDVRTTSRLHIDGKDSNLVQGSDPAEKFSDVLFKVVDSANRDQLSADELEERMMINPESVNIHEVMIASEKARLSITFLKSITEKAIRAYSEIMAIR